MQTMEYLKQQTAAIAVPRRVGLDRHDTVRDHIADEMAALGLAPFHGSSFIIDHTVADMRNDGNKAILSNIAGIRRGTRPEAAPVLVGAHYDSVIAGECADDNATSVASLLHMAGALRETAYERSIIFVAFDAEEPPYFGSRTMGSEQFMQQFFDREGPALSIIMDLLAHKSGIMADKIACSGMENSPALLDMLRSVSRQDLAIVPVTEVCVGAASDHKNILSRNYDYLFFSSGLWPEYHTARDTVAAIDFEKLARFNLILQDIIIKSASRSGGYESGNCYDAMRQDCWRIIGKGMGCPENTSIEMIASNLNTAKMRE